MKTAIKTLLELAILGVILPFIVSCRMTSTMALPGSLANYDRIEGIEYEQAGILNQSSIGVWLFSIPIKTPSAQKILSEHVPEGWLIENLDIDSTYTVYFWPIDFPYVKVRGNLLRPKDRASQEQSSSE